MSNITVKNVSNSTVVLILPDLRFRRELVPGRSIPITQEEYDALSFDPGVNSLVGNHYIAFSGVDDVLASTNPVDTKEIARMLDERDVTAFAKFIPNAAQAEKDAVVQLAIDKGVTAPAFVSLIKKYCNDVDIIQAINMKHLAEE